MPRGSLPRNLTAARTENSFIGAVPSPRRRRLAAASAAAAVSAASADEPSDVLLLYVPPTSKRQDEWTSELVSAGVPHVVYPDDVERLGEDILQHIKFAAVFRPPADLLRRCPNLKAVSSLGIGVDSIIPCLPQDVVLTKLVLPLMAERMATWVTWAVLNTHRRMDEYYRSQQEQVWNRPPLKCKDNGDVRIAVLGRGAMGSASARALHALGYKVKTWSRTAASTSSLGMEHVAGATSLGPLVAESDVVVCLLPLTSETRGLLNQSLFAQMPHGAAIINAGRGAHLVEDDLLAALETGQVGHAVIDVAAVEPLPQESQLWKHPNVRITPHISSTTDIPGAVRQIADNFMRVQEGSQLQNVVDPSLGY